MSNINQRDPKIIADALLPWLQRHLPDADAIDLPAPQLPSDGGSSETFFLRPSIRRGATTTREQWVLRVQATGFQVYQDPSVERQYRVMDALAQSSDVPVPKVFWYEEDSSILGAPFFLMEHVEGVLPDTMAHSQGVLLDMTPAARETLWLSALEALARLDRVPTAPFAFLARPDLGATGLDQEIAIWDNYDQWCGVAERPVQAAAHRWLHDHLPAHRSTGIAWGDARIGNMVFRDGACRAVIDWETASLAGAESDLAWWLLNDWLTSEGLGIARLEGIGGRDATLAAWEHFAGRPARSIVWYDVFATWRFSRIIDRHRSLTTDPHEVAVVLDSDGSPILQRLAGLIGDRLNFDQTCK